MSKTENGGPEEVYPNYNIPTGEKRKHKRFRPEVPIMENYIKSGEDYIKNEKQVVPGNQTYAEVARNLRKIGE